MAISVLLHGEVYLERFTGKVQIPDHRSRDAYVGLNYPLNRVFAKYEGHVVTVTIERTHKK